MHIRMATYRFRGDAHELAERAEEGLLPIFQEQPGFRSYTIATDADEIISASVWDSRAEAEAGSEAAAEWVAENMTDDIELVGVRYAELLVSTALNVHA